MLVELLAGTAGVVEVGELAGVVVDPLGVGDVPVDDSG
jgi:hypothetical protein